MALVAILLPVWVVAEDLTPVTTLGPALGVSSARLGAVAGMEFTCSAPILPIFWAGGALQLLPDGRTGGQGEAGVGFPVIPVRVYGSVSGGYGSEGAFAGISLPVMLEPMPNTKIVLLVSPFLRYFPWEVRGPDWEAGVGLKAVLTVPKFHLYY
jgi:hypothetical protein